MGCSSISLSCGIVNWPCRVWVVGYRPGAEGLQQPTRWGRQERRSKAWMKRASGWARLQSVVERPKANLLWERTLMCLIWRRRCCCSKVNRRSIYMWGTLCELLWGSCPHGQGQGVKWILQNIEGTHVRSLTLAPQGHATALGGSPTSFILSFVPSYSGIPFRYLR